MKPLTLILAEFIAPLQYEQIPEEAVERVKQCLLDALGCAIYGATANWCRITNEFVKSQEGIAEASLWRNDFKGPASNVVLGNGSMIHGCDFDDYHMAKIHPGAVVIPVAVAIAEKEHLDGKKLIAAMVAGYETMIHISHGLNPGASRSKG